MRNISTNFLNKLNQSNRKIELKQWIDWDNDRVEDLSEIITDDILSLTIDKKLEGNLGKSIVDRATVTIDNSRHHYSPKNMSGKWAGNVLPTRYSKIWVGVDGELLDVFDGSLKSIKPTFNNKNTSITIDDDILLLQKTDCPDKFYYNMQAENIIKEWLDQVNINYTASSINRTNTAVNYNFAGKKMWEAILYIVESTWGQAFIDNGVFNFITKLSPDYTGEAESIYSFSALNKDNIWEIKEELSATEIFNRIEVKANPYLPQNKQIVWTGSEDQSEKTEEYSASLISNNQLQLTCVPAGEINKQPTENVPIVQDTLSVLDITSGIEYTLQNGGLANVNDKTGLVTFANNVNHPTPSLPNQLQIKYRYHFNRIVAQGRRHFYIELENPTIALEDLIIFARGGNSNEADVSFVNSSADVYVQQQIKANQQKVEVTIVNNLSSTIELYGKINNREIPNMLLRGRPFKQTTSYQITEVDQNSIDAYKIENTLSIQNDLINSENRLRQMVQYLLYEYSTPKSKIQITTRGVPHLELTDIITIEQLNRDIDLNFMIKGIKHKINQKGSWDIDLELEQANPSDWAYTEKGTPVLTGKKEINQFDIIPPADVSGFSSNLDGVLKTGMNRVKLSWDHNTELDLEEYYIYRKLTTDAIWTFLKAIKKGSNEYIDTSIIYNGIYDYKITAVDRNKNESSINSAPSTTITVADVIAPSIPQWATEELATEGQFKSVYLRWLRNMEKDVAYYNIYVSVNGINFNYLDRTSGTRYKHDGLENERTYYYKITAVDLNDNESEFSLIKAGTTKLIQDTDMVQSIFMIIPFSDPNPSSGILPDLWDKDTTTGVTFDSLNGDSEIVITYEYPTMWFFDMAKFRTSVNCQYYIQVFFDESQSWINVAGNSGTSLIATGNVNTIIEFDKRMGAKKLRIIFDRVLTLYELKFTTIVIADEILSGKIKADMITIGGGTTFESDMYNPVKVEERVKKYTEAQIINNTKTMLFPFNHNLLSTNGINPEAGYIVTLKEDQGKFGGAVAVEDGTENLLSTAGGGAAQDWSKWSHWSHIVYWGIYEQYDDPDWGKVFKGTKDGATLPEVFIYDYYPYSYAIGDILTFSCWMKVNRNITKKLSLYINSGSGGQHGVASKDIKTITFKSGEWQYITWTSGAVTETVSGTGGFGIFMDKGWEGCIVEVAYPQFEKKSFATSFAEAIRATGSLKYSLNIPNGSSGFFRYYAPFEIKCTNTDIDPGVAISGTRMFALVNTLNGDFLDFKTYKDVPYIESVINGIGLSHIHHRWIPQANTWYGVYWELDNDRFTVKVYDVDGNLIKDWVITDNSISDFSANQFLYCIFGGSAIYDENIIMPSYLSTNEQIQAWSKMKKPFYDPSPKIIVPKPSSVILQEV